uniref:Uncharacterized protein n=1 Tax=Anopheles maculatus TaxID=74869 RepID=A0A182SHD2_9DIPT
MKQTPESDRSDSRSCRIDSGLDSGLNPSRMFASTGFDRSQPDSMFRIQSECSGFNRSTSELRSAPDSIGVLRSSGVESGILSDSESVFNMWIRSGFVNPLRSSHH